jgi:hypothetical protein
VALCAASKEGIEMLQPSAYAEAHHQIKATFARQKAAAFTAPTFN